MAKVKFFSLDNIKIGLKASGSSILTGFITLIPLAVAGSFINEGMVALGVIGQILILIFGLLLFGFFSKKFWGWE